MWALGTAAVRISFVVRLWVAVWPPPDVVGALAAFDRPALADVHWSAPERWTVKIRPLGHVDAGTARHVGTVLAAELDGAPAVECRLGPVTRRLGGQWLGGQWLGPAGRR